MEEEMMDRNIKSRAIVIDNNIKDFEIVGESIIKMTQSYFDEFRSKD